MAEQTTGAEEIPLTRHQRYYAIHREDKLAKVKQRYQNNPEYIAMKEEKKREKAQRDAEKAAMKEAKRIEKEKARLERLALAIKTAKKKKNEGGGLDSILGLDTSGKR